MFSFPYDLFLVLGDIFFSTVHINDMYDREDNRKSGRWTVSLEFGDASARWLLSMFITSWSLFVLWSLHIRIPGVIVSLAVGILVCLRNLLLNTVSANRITIIFWNI